MQHIDLARNGLEFARAIDARHFEITDDGLYFPKQRAIVQGQFDTWINGRDHQVDANIVPTEALNYLLKTGIKNTGGLGTWFIAPFLNNVTLTAALTAANYEATLDEFTLYDEATRVAWTTPADPTAGSFTNAATPSSFTIAAGVVAASIVGAGILSASAKEAITGKLLCASKFAAARVVNTGDILTVQYTLSATSTA